MATGTKVIGTSVRAGGVLAAAVLSVVGGVCGTARGFDVGYHPMPFDVYALSYDGTMVVGTGGGGSMTRATQAGIWTHGGAYYGRPSGGHFSAVNDDGSVVGGTVAGNVLGYVALIDRGNGNFTTIGYEYQSSSYNIQHLSGDGQRAVVRRQGRDFVNQYVIDHNGTALPLDSRYYWADDGLEDMSRDGTTVIGSAYPTGNSDVSFPIRSVVGGIAEILPTPAGNWSNSWARGVSANGSIVSGFAYGPSGYQACLWTSQGVLTVPPPPGYTHSSFGEMNDDATVILGGIWGPNGNAPAIYLSGTGWVIASEYFATNGVTIPEGRRISWLTNVSSDGRTFTGELDNGQNFVAVVPSPGVVGILAACGLIASRRRVRGGSV
jgi:hypothetical protein